MRFRFLLLFAVMVTRAFAAETPAPASHPLSWDAMEKNVEVKPGDDAAAFTFSVTNQSAARVEIAEIRPSCGCTVAEMPSTPWILEPGAKGSFNAVVDIRGKQGKFSKSLYVSSTGGAQMLTVTVNIPDSPDAARERNRQMAAHDRQAVFRGECASCHVAPTVGKMGEQLFQAACAICHLANPRASMVPDLLVAREPRDAAYWKKWIAEGKESSLMPAFAQAHHGPLTDAQITSLVEFALARLPTESRKN